MTLTDYQTAALRTAGDELPPLWYLALGLCGEAGEVANLVKKFERHGKPFDAAQVADELGDVLWYLAVAAKAAGLTLDEVASRNVAKLQARYPAGFVPAGGGADADRAALGAVLTIPDATGRRHAVADHFVDADEMVGPNGLGVNGWIQHTFKSRAIPYNRSRPGSEDYPIAGVAYSDGLWEAWSFDLTKSLRGMANPATAEQAEKDCLDAIRKMLRDDHSADASKMVAAPVTTEQPELPALRPMDDNVRCAEWELLDDDDYVGERLRYVRGYDRSPDDTAALAYGDGGWMAFQVDDISADDNGDLTTIEAAKLAAEAWLRERHPFFDADWPGLHGNPPRVEVGAP